MAARGYRAAVFASPERIDVRQVPAPEPGPHEVRIALEGCGICASNLPVWEGRPWFDYPLDPGAPGHEPWGRIDAVGPGAPEFLIGQRVAALAYRSYADADIARADAVVQLPRALDDVPFPGEPLACAMNILARSCVKPGQAVAIVGAGFIGCLLVQLTRAAGATVAAISRRRFALDLARQSGAACTIEWRGDGHPMCPATQAGGARFDCVIEAVGSQASLDLASALVRERGRLVIAGYHQDGTRSVDLQSWNWRGLDVVNAHERAAAEYLKGMRIAVDAIQGGVLDPAPLYTHRIPLGDIGAGFELLRSRPDGFLKALLVI